MNGHVFTAPDGVRGFDANIKITPAIAKAFFEHGYRFAVRYLRRKTAHDFDLDAAETSTLLAAGLGLMAVQHVAPEGWAPTPDLGTSYGQIAAAEAQNAGIPAGVTVWLDLEGVQRGTPADQVTAYCNNWHSEVAGQGFVPGLYVGDACGLSPRQLYALRFIHYWGAYNLNRDEEPARRGLQMRQRVRQAADLVHGYAFEFQVDVVGTDTLGGRPTLVAPESWLEIEP